MQHKDIITEMHFENANDMTKAQIKKLKKETLDFLGRSGWHVGDIMPYYIPWHLIIVPEYQYRRALNSENNNSIDKIVSNYDNDRYDYAKINYRTDGDYAGLFTIIDGYHRARATERLQKELNIEGVLSRIITTSKEKEIILFADQDEGKTTVPLIIKYEAWMASNDETNINVLASHKMTSILNKYHLEDIMYKSGISFGISQAFNICKKTINNDCYEFDWMMEILKHTGISNTTDGLRADMFTALHTIFGMIKEGRFGEDATYDNVKNILKSSLKGWTFSTLEQFGTFVTDESAKQAKDTDRRRRVTNAISCMICKAFNLTTYGYHNSINDFPKS